MQSFLDGGNYDIALLHSSRLQLNCNILNEGLSPGLSFFVDEANGVGVLDRSGGVLLRVTIGDVVAVADAFGLGMLLHIPNFIGMYMRR